MSKTLEAMAKALCADCPGCGDDGGCWDDTNRMAERVIDALRDNITPEMVTAFSRGFADLNDAIVSKHGGYMPVGVKWFDEAVMAGLTAALEEAKK